MISESGLVLFVLMTCVQSSTLWSSLLLVPMSAIGIYSCVSVNSNSSVIMFMYAMVFISGLLVLLVSVASISYQEATLYLTKEWIAVSLFSALLLFELSGANGESLVSMSSWVIPQPFLVSYLILSLVLMLIVITSLVTSFKGLIRSL